MWAAIAFPWQLSNCLLASWIDHDGFSQDAARSRYQLNSFLQLNQCSIDSQFWVSQVLVSQVLGISGKYRESTAPLQGKV